MADPEGRELDLVQRGHRNLMARYRRLASADGGVVVDCPTGMIWTTRSEHSVLMNGAVPFDDSGIVSLASEAKAFFSSAEKGFSLLTSAQIHAEARQELVAQGFRLRVSRFPVMVRRTPVRERCDVSGIEIRFVEHASDVRDYVDVIGKAFCSLGFPADTLCSVHADLFLGWPVASVVAYKHGVPVATASVHVEECVGGIQWVGVLPHLRRQGIAAQCVGAVANHAFELGADVAWLEASPLGVAAYRAIGFETITGYSVWLAMSPK